MVSAKTIEVIAPSSPCTLTNESRIVFESKGFKVNIPNDLIVEGSPYEANTVAYRVTHLIKATNDKNVLAIFVLRGGYSSTKIAKEISELSEFPQKKFIVGYSDLTALFAVLNTKHGWLCVHGPVFNKISEQVNPKCVEQTIDIITGKIKTLSIPGLVPLNNVTTSDKIEGKLVGGNLCVLQTTIGTNWQVSCQNKILFLEDWNEPGYKIDRMLTHLKQSGMLKGVKALILGQFLPPKCDSESEAVETINTINYALTNFAKSIECPVYKTEAFGHGYENIPLVIGANAEVLIDANNITLSYAWDCNFGA
jgi:muramoyltetrapeptide carboxypeptidase